MGRRDAALLQKSIGVTGFLRADIIVPKCQVVILDCSYLCLKPLLSENTVSLLTLVGVALSWALLACQLWLPSTAMRRVFLGKAAATLAFKMHSQRGGLSRKSHRIDRRRHGSSQPCADLFSNSSYRLLKVSPPPQLASHDMGGEQRVQEVQLIAPGGIGGVMGNQHQDVNQKKGNKKGRGWVGMRRKDRRDKESWSLPRWVVLPPPSFHPSIPRCLTSSPTLQEF